VFARVVLAFSYGGFVEGTVFSLELPVSVVRSFLPDGLEVVPSGDTHWVVFTFCTQTKVGSPFTDFNYKEFILSVPFVQWDGAHAPQYPYRGPFSYLPHLYLNESVPVALGQFWVGDNKEFSIITQDISAEGLGHFAVIGAEGHAFTGLQIVNASWDTHGASYQHASSFPAFSRIAASLNLPSIGRYPPSSGEWKCLPQDYHTNKTLLMPAQGKMTIGKQFYGKLPTGDFVFSALNESAQSFGGFRYQTEWQYTSLSSNCSKFHP